MKKLFYTFALLSILSVAASSCTKEEVKPQVETNNTGGGVSDRF
jgi:hypothetical protein